MNKNQKISGATQLNHSTMLLKPSSPNVHYWKKLPTTTDTLMLIMMVTVHHSELKVKLTKALAHEKFNKRNDVINDYNSKPME